MENIKPAIIESPVQTEKEKLELIEKKVEIQKKRIEIRKEELNIDEFILRRNIALEEQRSLIDKIMELR